MKTEKIKNIVCVSLINHYALGTTLWQIAYQIADEWEKDALELWTDLADLPSLEKKAVELYYKYREEYYREND